jgi:hypothetical protein
VEIFNDRSSALRAVGLDSAALEPEP